MPTTIFQKLYFTFLTVAISVFVFVTYNMAIIAGGMTNQVLLDMGPELLYEFPLAFLGQLFFAGPLSARLAFRIVNPTVDNPRIVVLTITFMTIAIMCPFMSFVSTLIHHGINPELLSQWLQAMFVNFPVAVFSQYFIIGPFVRLVFRSTFKIKCVSAGFSSSNK